MGNQCLFTALSTILSFSVFCQTPTPSTSYNWEALQPKTYAVERGDTLATIAQSIYGDEKYWVTLWVDNQWLENPNMLFSEQQLTLRDRAKELEADLPDTLLAKIQTRNRTLSIAVADKPLKLPEPENNQPAPAKNEAEADQETTYDSIYKAAGEKYSVPWQVLYGLHLTESGLRGSGMIYNHQGSGATGPMQFMPGTWRAYGVDGNQDGIADIHNVEDAIYGAANYLQRHGNLDQALRSYGGNMSSTLQAAYNRGYSPQ